MLRRGRQGRVVAGVGFEELRSNVKLLCAASLLERVSDLRFDGEDACCELRARAELMFASLLLRAIGFQRGPKHEMWELWCR